MTSLTFDAYRPGVTAELLALHMRYYAPAWGFARPFESKVAADLGTFLARYDAARDLFLTAWTAEGALAGSITIDGQDPALAHLRWFIVARPGGGLGEQLMQHACAFADARGHAETYLTTFRGLKAAARLYARHGFTLAAEHADDPWAGPTGRSVGEQRLVRPHGATLASGA